MDRVKLVTSDAHAGLLSAIGATLLGASWAAVSHPIRDQPDGNHPKSLWPWVRNLLHSVFDAARRAVRRGSL
jgi:putative transposase